MLKILTTLALSSACLLAQQVRAFDELNLENGVYSLESSGWHVHPGTLSLATLEDELVEVTGTLDTSGLVPTLTLATAALADDTFEVDGPSTIGTVLDLSLESATATYCFVLAAQAGDPTPLDVFGSPLYTGTSYLQQPGILVSSGLFVAGAFAVQLPIPNNPTLIGAELRLQAGVANGAFMLINAVDIEVLQ